MKSKLQVLDQSISTTTREGVEYICITDIAKYKGSDRTAHIIGNWVRNRNTIEFLGIWEKLKIRIVKLNQLAIQQMSVLLKSDP